MERLLGDLRYGALLLLRNKAFATTAVVTLAVCIAANAAIFCIVNSVVLRPLPFPEADRLVYLYNSYPKAGIERASTGVPDYLDRVRDVRALGEQDLRGLRGDRDPLDRATQLWMQEFRGKILDLINHFDIHLPANLASHRG